MKGMSCAACASSVEEVLNDIEGVSKAEVNFANSTVTIKKNSTLSFLSLKEALIDNGYDLKENTSNKKDQDLSLQKQLEKIKRNALGSLIFTLPVFVLGMFFMEWNPGKWISMLFSIPVLFYFGRHFFSGFWSQLKRGKSNMDSLVAISTGIAFLYSVFNTVVHSFFINTSFDTHVYFEASTVIITFISIGKWLEEKSKMKTRSAIKGLMELMPNEVLIIDDNRNEVIKDLQEISIGDRVLIKPGMKIPVDGIVLEGHSFVNESMLTGEPLEVEKSIDSSVFAGTINTTGSFIFKANKIGESTFLASIIRAVEDAQGSKAKLQRKVDVIASFFVPVVLVIALLTFVLWFWLGEDGVSQALVNSVAVLVIACPCALGLATPTALMVGIGKGAENNILIKDADSLELGAKIDTIVLDKTGTVTKGEPKVVREFWKPSSDNERLESVLVALEKKSEHPLAKAILSKFTKANFEVELEDYSAIIGVGVKAKFKDEIYVVSNEDYIHTNHIFIEDSLKISLEEERNNGSTLVCFSNRKEVLAILAIEDTLKEEALSSISELRSGGIDIHLLSGDNKQAVKSVADKLGINNFKGNVLPDQKLLYIKKLQEKGKVVAMVGDGINDAQALAQSDVSIAMGHGTDVAMEVAMITITTSKLDRLMKAIVLSKSTLKGIHQNLFWAFIYNLVGIPIAAGILIPIFDFALDPMIAGGAMAMSSVSVLLNSLRLKNVKL